jgi:hypothetical protein
LCAAAQPQFAHGPISPFTQIVLPRLAGLPMDYHNAWPPGLGSALLRQAPLFLGARLEYNWGQLPDWPGLTQLYPLALVVALALLWTTLRARLFPHVRPHVVAAGTTLQRWGARIMARIRLP